ncbi:MAG TPA: DUF4446 family protein [Candidatus Limnocylindria bacterium]|nr:DUF4446 family protein [Candidatus Limnocylindria bacterium]
MQLTSPTVTLILSILAFVAAAYCIWQSVAYNKLRKAFFAGTKALDLESVIMSLQTQLQESGHKQEFLEQELVHLKHAATFSVQKVGLVRFNPFNDGGGNFSFCLALMDAHDTGVILTSMYGREQNRIYTKKIENGKSDVALTDEEKKAVEMANTPKI